MTKNITALFVCSLITFAILASPFLTFVGLKCVAGATQTQPHRRHRGGNQSVEDLARELVNAIREIAPPKHDLSAKPGDEPAEEPAAAHETDTAKPTPEAEPEVASAWYRDAESRPFVMLTRFAVLSAAALFGALGATISLLGRPNSGTPITIQQLVGLQLVGAVFAFILALIFAGGFIQGSLFPAGFTSGDSWFSVIYVHPEFAKLLVWSFIAGFSERVVPQILKAFSERIRGDVNERTSREPEKGA